MYRNIKHAFKIDFCTIPNLQPFAIQPDRKEKGMRYSLDSSKIKSFGWKPKHSFKEGLKETVGWYLENEWWWKPLADERILHPTSWNLEW